ncbi:MAG: efflux transporter outer membrane subunit [Rikenellaceae bacterium]
MKEIKYITCSLWVALTMSSCGIYSKYQRSSDVETLTDDLYKYSQATASDTSIASLSWRELFTDPALQSLIEQALAQNTDLNVAQLNVEQAEIALSTARKAFLPSLWLEPQGSISSFNGVTSKTYNVSFTSSWEIDVFGKLRNAKEQNKALLEQSEAYAQAVQTSLIATIAQSYYSLLMLDEQLKISEETRENWEKNIRVMNAMKSAGRINETSVLQSEASSIALNSSIVTLKEQIAVLENSLSLLLAQPTTHIERGYILSIEFSDKLSTGLPIELLSNRPDVRMAESYLAEMFYATAEARSSLYPSLTLSGSAGYTNSSGVVTNPGDILYNLAGSILQPIFNRGALKAQLKISKSQQEQALLQFKQSILDAGAEVNNAISELQSSRERLQYGEHQIAVLEKTVTKTELLMRHGSSTTLDVLVAQLSLLQAQLSFSTEKYNQTQGVINLYRALGGGEE